MIGQRRPTGLILKHGTRGFEANHAPFDPLWTRYGRETAASCFDHRNDDAQVAMGALHTRLGTYVLCTLPPLQLQTSFVDPALCRSYKVHV